MTDQTPRTDAGRALNDYPDIGLDGYGYVLPDDWTERIRAIEAEAAAQARAEALDAVDRLAKKYGYPPYVAFSDVRDAILAGETE